MDQKEFEINMNQETEETGSNLNPEWLYDALMMERENWHLYPDEFLELMDEFCRVYTQIYYRRNKSAFYRQQMEGLLEEIEEWRDEKWIQVFGPKTRKALTEFWSFYDVDEVVDLYRKMRAEHPELETASSKHVPGQTKYE